jgi:hypothetical protein
MKRAGLIVRTPIEPTSAAFPGCPAVREASGRRAPISVSEASQTRPARTLCEFFVGEAEPNVRLNARPNCSHPHRSGVARSARAVLTPHSGLRQARDDRARRGESNAAGSRGLRTFDGEPEANVQLNGLA